MTDLDEMTKAELLEYAQQIGVSPANNNMTKEELREGVDAKLAEEEGPQPDQQAAPEQQVTTTMTKDYLGVPLVNPTPGTSQATDSLGRSVVSGNKDYMNRALVP